MPGTVARKGTGNRITPVYPEIPFRALPWIAEGILSCRRGWSRASRRGCTARLMSCP